MRFFHGPRTAISETHILQAETLRVELPVECALKHKILIESKP